jgi:hypothetical protein
MNIASRTFPSRIADLGFSARLPDGWIAHELPDEPTDFTHPTAFHPLAIVTAPYAALIFSFAARPAFDDGTLHDWAHYLLDANRLQPRAIGACTVAGVPALAGEAVQDSPMGPLLVRFAFLEDGGRLLNLTLTAPEALASTVSGAWFAMLESFTLETPRGSRLAKDDALPEKLAPASTPPPAQDAQDRGGCTFARFAKSDTAASLDPEHPINANLRSDGAGLVPNVIATDDSLRCATVAAGAITAFLSVPYGWHVIDDGRRTLVLDPDSKIQISLQLIPLEGRTWDGLLDEIDQQMRRDYPDPQFLRFDYGKIRALAARNISDGAQPLEQIHMLYPSHVETTVLRARVTTTPDETTNAGDLAELILGSCSFAPAQEKMQSAPDWLEMAAQLEQQNRVQEAEAVIRNAIPHLAFALVTAQMHRSRMLRMKQSGNAVGALAAFREASRWIYFYAGQATSGGEGIALSKERDEFLASLAADYGSDPETTD